MLVLYWFLLWQLKQISFWKDRMINQLKSVLPSSPAGSDLCFIPDVVASLRTHWRSAVSLSNTTTVLIYVKFAFWNTSTLFSHWEFRSQLSFPETLFWTPWISVCPSNVNLTLGFTFLSCYSETFVEVKLTFAPRYKYFEFSSSLFCCPSKVELFSSHLYLPLSPTTFFKL